MMHKHCIMRKQKRTTDQSPDRWLVVCSIPPVTSRLPRFEEILIQAPLTRARIHLLGPSSNAQHSWRCRACVLGRRGLARLQPRRASVPLTPCVRYDEHAPLRPVRCAASMTGHPFCTSVHFLPSTNPPSTLYPYLGRGGGSCFAFTTLMRSYCHAQALCASNYSTENT